MKKTTKTVAAKKSARKSTSERPMNKRLAVMTAPKAPVSKPAVVKTEKPVKAKPMFKCICCDEQTKGDFKQGHDAKTKSQLKAKLGVVEFDRQMAAFGSVAAVARRNGYVGGKSQEPTEAVATKKSAKKASKKDDGSDSREESRANRKQSKRAAKGSK